ncbi:amino acid ABC transporter ATP-binding protein [Limosilactobacillus ingluviei]|uniref:ABC superfamily ATP binding cassette transporter, ABC protein n=2 Tax=Limosilactobacillus ingluviei TaxID=148604 RepID=A0A0R1U9J9_9LACO|nr:amino acid ABC transporter ATP-binding protein [Limosilactobacillus ingluviei]KRL90006.1 ABC superfamily ATP binding cassette transporter, ABC protein [Limosilactobacillus ingluviei DSM 15946]MDO4603491.1 amino acid ABC transporter ATP-binding protein [Limosilactobacillus ingluviei]
MLEIKNLKKSFDGRQILNGVDLTVEDGQILCIVGPSGAGKTTLLRCITGLEAADSGEFLIDGQPFDPKGMEASDAVMGVVFQDFNLFPHLSVLENITLAPQLVLKEAKAAAEQRGLDLLDQLGLEDKGGLYPYQLSGGQKQRVAIARALAMKPKILCYDEPTSALDPQLRDEVATLLLKLKAQGMTQLVVTHDMDFAEKIADKLLKVTALDQKG